MLKPILFGLFLVAFAQWTSAQASQIELPAERIESPSRPENFLNRDEVSRHTGFGLSPADRQPRDPNQPRPDDEPHPDEPQPSRSSNSSRSWSSDPNRRPATMQDDIWGRPYRASARIGG